MTVRELIAELETIEDKDLEVVIDECYDYGSIRTETVDTVFETEDYFGKVEEGGYVAKTRPCVKLLP